MSQPERYKATAPDESRLTLRAQAYDAIRHRILNGDMLPGVRSSERMIAEDLIGMSRTPVREALAVLEATGVVRQVPQVGIEVRVATHDDALRSLRLRVGMETEIAAEAALLHVGRSDALKQPLEDLYQTAEASDDIGFMLADTRLHRQIAQLAGFKPSLTALEGMRDRTHLYRLHSGHRLTAEDMRAANEEHATMIAALVSNEPEAARHAVEAHLVATYDRILAAPQVPPVELRRLRPRSMSSAGPHDASRAR